MVSISKGVKRFSQLDYLAPNVTLNVGGSSGFKTAVGAILTIGAFSTFAFISYIMLFTYFRTDNPEVTQELKSEDLYPKIDLLKHRLLPIIYPYLDDIIPVQNDVISKYATFVMSKTRYLTVTNDDGSQEAKVERFIMDFKSCGDLLASGKNRIYTPGPEAGYIFELTKDYGLCAEYHETETYIQGRITDDVYEEVSVEVYPCSLDDSSKCVDSEELSRVSFIYAVGSVNTDLANKQNPLKPRMDGDDYFYININSGIQYQSRMMQTSIWDNEGYFFGTSKRDSYFSVEKVVTSMATRDGSELYCTKAMIHDRSCNWFYFFLYISGGKEARITRSYKEFITTMGDIGGVREFVYFLVFTFYKFYNDRHRKHMMVAQVYNLQREAESSLCCKSKPTPDQQTYLDGKSFEAESQIKLQEKAPQTVIDGAFELIEAKLDAVALIKQLNELKVITNHLLKAHHLPLVPAVSLELEWTRSKTLAGFRKKIFDGWHPPNAGNSSHRDEIRQAVCQVVDKKESEPVDGYFWKLLSESWIGGEGSSKGRPAADWEGPSPVKANLHVPSGKKSAKMFTTTTIGRSNKEIGSKKSILEAQDSIRQHHSPIKMMKIKPSGFHPIAFSRPLKPK